MIKYVVEPTEMITDATEGNTEGSIADTTTIPPLIEGSCVVSLVSRDINMTQQLILTTFPKILTQKDYKCLLKSYL